MHPTPTAQQRRYHPNELRAESLLGRALPSFAAADLDALPAGSSFRDDHCQDPAGWTLTKLRRGTWEAPRSTRPLTATEMLTLHGSTPWGATMLLVTVGEVLSVERPDTVDALTSLDALLPLPTRPLDEPRSPSVAPHDLVELVRLAQRAARICRETGAIVSIAADAHGASVRFVGPVVPTIAAEPVPHTDHMRTTLDGVAVSWTRR